MDIVYPLKPGSKHSEFKHSLRSLKNVDHDNVWVIGYKPEWVRNVNHIYTDQNKSKYKNLCNNIAAACESDQISDPFIIFNDDMFVLQPIPEIPTWWRETVDEGIARYERRDRMRLWELAMKDCRSKLKNKHKIRTSKQLSYELHIPMIVHKSTMLEALNAIPYGPVWRTIYGNMANLGGHRHKDVKLGKGRTPKEDDWFASSSDDRFANDELGKYIKKQFSRPGYYE